MSISMLWARWESVHLGVREWGFWLCVFLLLFLYLILSQLCKQHSWHSFCNVWYFKTSNVTHRLALMMNLCILWMLMNQRAEENCVFASVNLNKKPLWLLITANTHLLCFCRNHLEVQVFNHVIGFEESLMAVFSMHTVGVNLVCRQNQYLWGAHQNIQVRHPPPCIGDTESFGLPLRLCILLAMQGPVRSAPQTVTLL